MTKIQKNLYGLILVASRPSNHLPRHGLGNGMSLRTEVRWQQESSQSHMSRKDTSVTLMWYPMSRSQRIRVGPVTAASRLFGFRGESVNYWGTRVLFKGYHFGHKNPFFIGLFDISFGSRCFSIFFLFFSSVLFLDFFYRN
jgi:hypothetical protein